MIHFPSRTLRNATAVLMLLSATSAFAEEGVLVGDLPRGVETPALLETAQRALLGRQWTVLRSDATSVDARRKHEETDCSLTVFVSDGVLEYRGSAKVPQLWGAGKDAKFITVDGRVPRKWLDELRADIKQSLSVPVSAGKAATAPRSNAAAASDAKATTAARSNASSAADEKGAPAPAANASTAEKLRELEALRKEGLISEPEYQRMRQAVLDAF